VVDDIDLINQQCQQVFRNYMDKYRSNVHFICACSNTQKVIDSIQSRLHILRLECPTKDQVSEIMQRIIHQERIPLSKDAQEYLLSFTNHNVREVTNHLEKLFVLHEPGDDALISVETCKEQCTNISSQQFELYLAHLRNGDMMKAIALLNDIHDYGYSVIDLLDYFFTFMKATTLLTESEKYKIIPLLCKYITNFHSIHENVIELALFSREMFAITGKPG
jgi:DNA polymerase III delta prime subunit